VCISTAGITQSLVPATIPVIWHYTTLCTHPLTRPTSGSLVYTCSLFWREVDQRRRTVRIIIMACRIYTRIFDGYTWISPLGKLADKESLQSRVWYLVRIPVALTQANPVLQIAMLQLHLHLYFIIRIRLSNEPLLSNGSDENQWGFGQTYALIMSAALVIECFKGYLSKYAYLAFQRTISLCYDKGYSNAKRRFVEHN
jgi:hypothetical protein